MISLRSEITRKLLNYFFLNPKGSLYVNELSRKLELDKRNLVKKLKQLEKEKVLKSEKRGNLKLYSINKEFPLYNEYKKIILKTMGLEHNLRRLLNDVRGIEKAYIYGSYAKDNFDIHSDIDLLIIGNHDIVQIQKKLNRLQKEIDREINVLHMNMEEFRKRIKNKDFFINQVLKNKHIEIAL